MVVYHRYSLCTTQWVQFTASCACKIRTIRAIQLKLWNTTFLRMTFHGRIENFQVENRNVIGSSTFEMNFIHLYIYTFQQPILSIWAFLEHFENLIFETLTCNLLWISHIHLWIWHYYGIKHCQIRQSWTSGKPCAIEK